MKVMIWKRLENATHSYHSEGGIVVFAKDHDRAMELLRTKSEDGFPVPGDCEAFTTPADLIYDAPDAKEGFFIFPDAGCC